MTILVLTAGLLCTEFQDFEERRLATIPEGLELGQMFFGEDGRSVAYVQFKKLPSNAYEAQVVLGDWRSQTFDPVWAFGLSADGRRVAYYGKRTEAGTSKDSLFVNQNLVLAEGDGWTMSWFGVLSPDGETVVCEVYNEKRKTRAIAVNGKRTKEYTQDLKVRGLTANGKTLAYALEGNGRYSVTWGDVKGPDLDYVTNLCLSSDGRVLAYAYEDEQGAFLLLGDRKTALRDLPSYIFMSQDGGTAGYVFRRGEGTTDKDRRFYWWVEVEGKKGPEFSEIVFMPAFSRDAKAVTYGASNIKSRKPEIVEHFVMIGDRKVETPNLASPPVFSKDGRMVGYGAKVGRELWWKVIKLD